MLLSGIGVGLAYLTKESGLLLLPFYFAFWLVAEVRRFGRSSIVIGAAFLLGFLIVFFAESAALSYLTGRPYFRLGWTFGTEEIKPWIVTKLERNASFPARIRWLRSEIHPSLFPTWLITAAAASLIIYPFLRPDRRRLALWVLPLWLFGYLTWGSMNFSYYLPPAIQARYYIVVIPFLAVIMAAPAVAVLRLLERTLPQRVRGRPAFTAGALLVLVPMLAGLRGVDVWAGNSYWSNLVSATYNAVAFARTQSSRPIVLSKRLAGCLEEPLRSADLGYVHNAQDITAERCATLLEQGGFHYIEFSKFSTWSSGHAQFEAPAPCPLDARLQAAIWHNTYDGTFDSRKLGDFTSWGSRWDVLRLAIFQSLRPTAPPLTWQSVEPYRASIRIAAAERYRKPESGVLGLYEITPPIHMISQDALHGLAGSVIKLTDLSPRMQTEAALADWDWSGSDRCQLTAEPDGRALIHLAMGDTETITLTPKRTEAGDAARHIATGQVATLCLQAQLSGDCRVRLATRVLFDSDPEQPPIDTVDELTESGCTGLVVNTSDGAARIMPQLTLSGRGEARLRLFLLKTRPESPAADILRDIGAHPDFITESAFNLVERKGQLTIPDWSYPSQDNVEIVDIGDGLGRLDFALGQRESIWVSAQKRTSLRAFACPGNGTYLVGLRFRVRGQPTGRLAGVLYADTNLQNNAVSEARFPLQPRAQAWFVIRTQDQPRYFRPVFYLMGEGTLVVDQTVMFASRPDAVWPR
jgi:hypothetical protein